MDCEALLPSFPASVFSSCPFSEGLWPSPAGELVTCADDAGPGTDSVFGAPGVRNRKPESAVRRADDDILEVEFKDETVFVEEKERERKKESVIAEVVAWAG